MARFTLVTSNIRVGHGLALAAGAKLPVLCIFLPGGKFRPVMIGPTREHLFLALMQGLFSWVHRKKELQQL